MSRKMDLLEPEFRILADKVLQQCEARGVDMIVFFTLRDPWTQSRLWRQSRSSHQVGDGIMKLEELGAPWLSEQLDSVGPQYGRWATNALPGQSYHQHGLAIDAFVLFNERAVWGLDEPGAEGYKVYARQALQNGLVAGYHWRSQDAYHIQLGKGSITRTFPWPVLDIMMRDRWESIGDGGEY